MEERKKDPFMKHRVSLLVILNISANKNQNNLAWGEVARLYAPLACCIIELTVYIFRGLIKILRIEVF